MSVGCTAACVCVCIRVFVSRTRALSLSLLVAWDGRYIAIITNTNPRASL